MLIHESLKTMIASLKYSINLHNKIPLFLSTTFMEFVADCLTNWREKTATRNSSSYITFKVGQKK